MHIDQIKSNTSNWKCSQKNRRKNNKKLKEFEVHLLRFKNEMIKIKNGKKDEK